MTQYEAAHKKRTAVATVLILALMPATILFGSFILDSNLYMVASLLLIVYTLIPFFMVFEKRKPKAREIVLIAMMTALTVVIHMIFHVTVPVQAGTAMIIICGIALGPEEGFLVGAIARFVCNFYIGQGPWTPWQMFCWGIIGFLAGIIFNKVDIEDVRSKKIERVKSRSFSVVLGPVVCIAVGVVCAYVCFLIWPGKDHNFFGWRLYAFGAAGLVIGLFLQKKRLPVDGLTMGIFTFFVTFIIYGGVMNAAAMVTTSMIPGGEQISINALRLVYVSGVGYDLAHASTAAVFIFLFGDVFIRKIERIKIKYGIYR